MASQRTLRTLLGLEALVILSMMIVSTSAQCDSETLYTLEPCLSSVKGKTPPLPSESCCSVIRTTELSCLCNAVSGYSNYGPGVNAKAALNLPKACGSAVPDGITCNGIPVPSGEIPATRKLKR